MKQQIAISVFTEDKPGVLEELTKIVNQLNCSVAMSRMTVLGNQSSVSMLVSGSWDSIAKLETQLSTMERSNNYHLIYCRTEPKQHEQKYIGYSVESITEDRPGVLTAIAHFFASHEINVSEVSSNTFTNHYGTTLSTLTMRLLIPININISDIREQFMVMCDGLNIDAILEPDRA